MNIHVCSIYIYICIVPRYQCTFIAKHVLPRFHFANRVREDEEEQAKEEEEGAEEED